MVDCLETNRGAGRKRMPGTLRASKLVALIALVCAIGLLGGPGRAEEANSGEKKGFVVGICTHFASGKRPIVPSLTLIQNVGINALRDDGRWALVEKRKGVMEVPRWWDQYMDIAKNAGIEPLLILDYGNKNYGDGGNVDTPEEIEGFVRYAKFIVEHFKGRVPRYEIWNEWYGITGHTKPGSPEDYVSLVKRVYPAVKATDPGAEVLVGAATATGKKRDFLYKILQLGVLKYADALSVHTYVHCYRRRLPEDWLAVMEDLQGRLRDLNGDKQLPLYVTEMGWPTSRGKCGSTLDQQARYLARLFLLARTIPSIRGIWWYDLQNDGMDPLKNLHNFGLVDYDLKPKPAYTAIADVAPIVRHAVYLGRVKGSEGDLMGLRFRMPDGTDVWALWCTRENESRRVTLGTNAPESLRFQKVGRHAAAPAWWANHGGEKQRARYRFSLTVRGMPWLISGNLEGVRIVDIHKN